MEKESLFERKCKHTSLYDKLKIIRKCETMNQVSAVLEIYLAFIVAAVWVCSYYFIDDIYEIKRYRSIPYVLLGHNR